MEINRYNYEDFFLLYADNELCATDKKAVEIFVAQNPDLKKELQLLIQTITGADDVVFENKEQLLKPAITPLQEQLLLYIDNELPVAEKQKVQQLLNVDAAANKEFNELQKTKLKPGATVLFANKKQLYRKEEGRVVRIVWWRAAAAAVLLGFGTWGVLTLTNTVKKIEETTAKKENAIVNPVQQTISNNVVAPEAAVKQSTNAEVINTEATATTNTKATPLKNSLPVNTNQVKEQLPVTDNNTAAATEVKKETNNLPEPLYNNFNNNNSNETVAANVTPTEEDATEKVKSGITSPFASLANTGTDAVNGYALNTSYNTEEADETNNNKVLYMNEENVKRTKIGSFLRRVKRVVERNTNVKTGNSIKVAGFNIALN